MNNEIVPVEIRPRQVKHYKRIIEILKTEPAYLDVSPCGSGKTPITCAIAATYGLSIGFVGPKSSLGTWKNFTKMYGIKLVFAITYQSLRGQGDCDLNHNLLTRVKDGYQATEYFENCVKNKMLLVFDEYHNLKNDNTQLASAHALVKSLVRLVTMGYKSRIALLSGTPGEDKKYVTSTFKMLGIILSDTLYTYNRSSKLYELLGIQEAINKCNKYDPNETFAISCRPINQTTAKTICYDLYMRVLKRFAVSSMPPPEIKSNKISRNLYINMPDKDVDRLKKGLMLFTKATNYKHEIGEVNYSGVKWGDVTKSRCEIDSAKIASVVRHAITNLETNKHCKVIIYCNYKNDMTKAVSLFTKYNPLRMDGSTNENGREDIKAKFNSNNDEYRVLVSNPKVGGVSIELDDKFGLRPRFTYILPSYFFTDQCQATERTYREGTKSDATIYFVYSRAFPYEIGILNSMAQKSEIARSMIIANNHKFPSEYEELVELTPEEIEDKNTNK